VKSQRRCLVPSKKNLAKIHIAKKELHIPDDAYRDILQNLTGHDSSARINDTQAEKVLRFFIKVKGWKPKYQQQLPGITIPSDPMSKKIQALWITLHKAGVVKNGSDLALLSFVKRVAETDRLEWCKDSDKNRIIEALKAWAKREGIELD